MENNLASPEMPAKTDVPVSAGFATRPVLTLTVSEGNRIVTVATVDDVLALAERYAKAKVYAAQLSGMGSELLARLSERHEEATRDALYAALGVKAT